jgi:NhaP-type Na+/H+ or K+/H+ antiporter
MDSNFEFNVILTIGIFLVIGFFGGLAARKINIPTISGFIIVGIILSLLNIIPRELIDGELNIITDVSLGIIGYLVGGGLYLKRLKQFGKHISVIAFSQAIGSWVFVTIILAFLCPFIMRIDGNNTYSFISCLPIAIVVGAISCATAPAASLAVIHEYKATGPFTTTLLAIIVIDDAIAVIAYSIGVNVADSMIIGLKNISLSQMLLTPIIDIFGAIILGTILGFGLVFIGKFIKRIQQLLVIVLGTVFLCIGLSNLLGLSSILANMVMGFIVVNRMFESEKMFEAVHNIEGVIFAMFFTLAGAHFDYSILKTSGIIAVILVISRFLGKFVGVNIGASISKAPVSFKKYLTFGLFPKAGVTIGLALLIKEHVALANANVVNIVINAIIASVILNELIAPPLIKFALIKSGEAYKKD